MSKYEQYEDGYREQRTTENCLEPYEEVSLNSTDLGFMAERPDRITCPGPSQLGGSSIMLWGCFSGRGLKKAKYRDILNENMIHCAQSIRLGKRFTFQRNISMRAAETTQERLKWQPCECPQVAALELTRTCLQRDMSVKFPKISWPRLQIMKRSICEVLSMETFLGVVSVSVVLRQFVCTVWIS